MSQDKFITYRIAWNVVGKKQNLMFLKFIRDFIFALNLSRKN